MKALRLFLWPMCILSIVGCTMLSSQSSSPVIIISPDVPADIQGGAENASLSDAARFAWQEFIALNWPAQAGVRDTPDPAQKFGAPTVGPLVWHTYRAKIELFPGSNSPDAPPHGYAPGGPGYDDPPTYIYSTSVSKDGQVQPCVDPASAATPAWINLDEITQIGLDSMFAGVAPAASTPINSDPRLIRFMAKANRVESNYVVQHSYWYDDSKSPLDTPRGIAEQNFTNAVTNNAFPPASPYISFPSGTIETKAAFRPLTDLEQQSNRFYSTRVRYYEQNGSIPCYHEETWGLIALHIIQKTPSAPSFIYATFEQADNLLTTVDGKTVAVEDENGNIIHAAPTTTSPALTYKDDPTNPQVSVVAGEPQCNTNNNPHLFYNNTSATGVPTDTICVNQRDHAIPPPIVTINQAAHQAIAAYSAANGIANSPWAYYKLVNVQAYPFNVTDIVADPSAPHNAATFYQANIVVETNYTLQNFNGRFASDLAPTNYTTAGKLYQQNVYLLNGTGALKASYDMGGCMGCHGFGAQSQSGSDFSFILAESPAGSPETPAKMNTEELIARYRALLLPASTR